MNIKTATKKELRQADIDAVQKKEIIEVKKEIYQNLLKDLDSCMEKSTALYSSILNNERLWKRDRADAQKMLDKAFLNCDEIQSARMECQEAIMECIMAENPSDKDYNEYEYNRSVDSQADEENALASIGWGEEW